METKDNLNKEIDSGPTDLDHNPWNDFIASQGHDDYFYNWVKAQCALMPSALQCVLFLADERTGAFSPVSRWPDSGEDPERLSEIAERVIDEKCGLLLALNLPAGINQSSLKRYGLGYPFFIDDKLQGLVVLEIQADKESQLAAAMSQLQWGSGWLELFFRRGQAQKDGHLLKKMKSAVDLMALVLAEKSFKGAAMAFVTQLALLLECDRVSLAFMKNNHSRIQAVSHSAQIEQRMNLNRAIELAMDEALTQRKDLIYPPPPGKEINIVRNHEQLARQYGSGCIFTMPFYGEGRYYGALTLERPDNRPFTLEDIEMSRSIGALIFPVLEAKRQNDRNLFFKALDSLKIQFIKFTGEGYAGRKTLAVLILALVIFFSFMKWDYRVPGNTTLEGKVRRSIVAPLEGYINEAFVRAGDTVEEGAVMCTLDDRDLRLERLNLISRQNQYQKQYQESVAGHMRADSGIIKAQLDQAAAQLELVEGEIKRTRITAPFKGLILSGDLSQRLGGSAQKGEVLFEIAPLDSYRMILDIDERHIGDIKQGQQGRVILSAMPDEGFGFVVDKITPLSNPKEGKNYFRVEATLKDTSERLRPGMTGVGKIYVGRRKLIDVLTRDLMDWLRIKAWAWRP